MYWHSVLNKFNSRLALNITLAAILFMALACGSSAPATTAPAAATSTPGAAQAASATAPAATATPVSLPPEVTVNPGTVTVMNAVWGNEIFDARDGVGETLNYGRPMHAYWTNGNRDLELLPGVASKWEISPDGLTWSFTIREGIKFHNGDELTVEDALFTFERGYGLEAREKALSPSRTALAKLTDNVEAVGNVVKVTHSQPQANFAFLHAQSGINNSGALEPKNYFEEVGADGYNLEPVGAGPFQVVQYRRSEQILMERFDDYYYQPDNGFPEDRRARFQTLDMRLVPEAVTRVAALRAAEADIVEASVSVKKQVEDGGGRIIFGREATYVWLILMGCQNEDFPCNKQDVRYALDFAIDKEAIMFGLYGDEGACVCGYNYASPSALGYSPEIDPFPFDPEKAKELLARAGYPNGEGFGTLNMYTWIAGDLPFMPELAQLVADQWKQNLGINAEVEVGDAATIRNRWFAKELAGGVLIRPNETKFDAASSLTGYYADFKGRIHFGAEREDLKQAVIDAKAELDPAKRQQAYNDMYKILYEAHYEPSLGHVDLPWGVSSRIATWDPWPMTPYLSSLWTITLK
jgi:peptide/nickel transport system substrate-binding protein